MSPGRKSMQWPRPGSFLLASRSHAEPLLHLLAASLLCCPSLLPACRVENTHSTKQAPCPGWILGLLPPGHHARVEDGMRTVRGLEQLPAHRIWEVSTHSTAVLDGAADLLHLPCQGGHTSSPAEQDVSCLPGTPWHVLLCCASVACARKGGCSWGTTREDVTCLALGDTSLQDAKLISRINLGTVLCCDKGRACSLEVLKGDASLQGPCVEHSLEDGLDLLGWSSGLDFPLEDCEKKSKWEKLFSGCLGPQEKLGKFQPFQPFGSKLCTGIKLNTNSQKGSALSTREMLICWRVSSAPIFEPFLLLFCNPPGRCLPTPNNLPRLFSLSKITSELSSSEKLL
ncbi:uncharacterized protein LOC135307998 [Passer domesticus]|uniref:uncharacterized protein LOC135307998 n=1 Tax=Passer domesticus TaxID=48849 RepID=UPI0030FE6784